jgi:ligand-binding sensor domain-containing protein
MTDGLVGDSVNWIMQDKTGILWFATRTGVSRFDGKSFTNFKTAADKDFDNARTVIEDRAGNIWIGGNDGLIRYRDGKLETLNSSFTGYLYEDKSGNVWTSSRSERGWSLSKYDGKTFELVIDKFGAGDFQGQVFGIYEDNVGNIWYGTVRGACMLENGKDSRRGIVEALENDE